MKKIAKNVESINLINKNIIIVATNLAVAEVKKLKTQILKLKVKLKELKYVSKKDHKPSQNIERNKKPPYKRPNHKPINKRNLECYKYDKKGHFKSECRSKSRNRIDYRNVQFLETEQTEVKSSDSEIEEVNLNYQRVQISNQKYNAAQDL